MLTQERLKELLCYVPYTGIFVRAKTVSGNAKIGSYAGVVGERGYRFINVDNVRYLAHRLAWFYMTGEWPKETIDHINRDKDDNRWINLREASYTQNKMNMSKQANNKSGFKGVFRDKRSGRWMARMNMQRRTHHLGLFDTPEEAHAAYVAYATKIHGDYFST